MDEAVAERPRHVRVDLRDDDLRHFGRRLRAFHADAETAVAVLVGGRNLDEGDVHGILPVVQERGDFRKEDRGEIGASFADRLADVLPDEEGVVAEVTVHFRPDIRGLADPEQMAHFHVVQVRVPFDHRIHEHLRHRAARMDVDPVTRLDDGDRLGGETNFRSYFRLTASEIEL